MKTPFYISLLAASFLVGCGDDQSKPSPSTNAASDNPLNAPADYVGGLVNGQARAIKTIDVAALNEAIQMFQAQENRFPKDLKELVEKKLISKIPDAPHGMKLDYDAVTGKVSVVKAE